jgi:hypothetical protein
MIFLPTRGWNCTWMSSIQIEKARLQFCVEKGRNSIILPLKIRGKHPIGPV